ncbi:MAG: UbiH/UbiF/VisC/COQ6 family ubiquinone biosynthesis hydroxylase, partial [Mariprofundaceae bacterium]|nr:UbiH/UbiF/VisC/COQ6 family ubiquinone biosynthesis hydroxylase [Mariprofundaceae bacterium]
VVIVGGGMVGLGLACALKDTGLSIVLVERMQAQPRLSLDRDCRVSAIVAGTVEMLRGIGVWEYIGPKAQAINGMRIFDDQRFGSVRFEADEADLQELGFLVENSVLSDAMMQVVHDSDSIELCCPASVDSVAWKASHVEVVLDDGRVLHTPLIVGADGGNSWLRTQAGIQVWSHRFMQRGIVATVRPQFNHRGVAYQRFLPTGPLAMLPMTGNLCSIVWSADDDEADRLMALDDSGFLSELQLNFGPMLGKIQEVGERAAFPLRSQLARHMVRPRLALIGDAAHQVHPLAGLGVNLGIRDAMSLAQEISDARRFREDHGSMDVLARMRSNRVPDVLAVMGAMEGFHHLFTSDMPGAGLLRGAGMRIVGNAGAVKHLLMRRATGLSLPLPKQIS